jgi:hypothetical protein
MRTLMRAARLALALGLAATAMAQPLRIVTAGAPAINCVFAPSCAVNVTDFSIPLFGTGVLQSRTYPAEPGSPAAGLWVYEYCIDLRAVAGEARMATVSGLALDFGPVVNTLDYDGDGRHGDQVFVVTCGGLGSMGPSSASQSGRVVTFRLDPPVHGGSAAVGGQTTYLFGMVSATPLPVTARVFTSGDTIVLQARAPQRRPIRPVVPPARIHPESAWATPMTAREDCLPYDPRNLRISHQGARGWLLTDGASLMLMLDNRADAGRAVALARRHTAHCFIGRGNPRPDRTAYITHYWTGNSGIPAIIPAEDCVRYDPAHVAVFDRGSLGWRMEDGSHLLRLFDNEADARQGLIVAKAATGRLCFIGRGNSRPDRSEYIVEYWQ